MLGLHNIFLISPSPPQQHINPQNELGLVKNDGAVLGNVLEPSLRACKDCGNRAKKECGFTRCRTCCNTKGYNCVTHVKSTWVPASTRKDKKLVVVGGGGDSSGGSSCGGGGGGKRPKLGGSYYVAANSYHQDARFKKSLPSQVFAPATFRCIRVTAISNGEAEVAYQATVNISGHVFKGFLYNQGIDEKKMFPKVPLESRRNRDSSSPIVDPPETFAVPND